MTMEKAQKVFSAADYAVFGTMLVVSSAIGFFYAWKERKKRTTDQVLLGGRKLKIFPVAMSIMASFTSAISVLGFAQEMYLYGSMYWLIGASYFITQPFAAHVYVPFFHRLRITSAYEYLERRFSHYVRVLASATFCVQIFFYMAVVLYTPSIAIQQVTGISLWVSICLTGLVCTVYTSLGGMKAVVYTDMFQVVVMFAGLIAVIVEGTRRVGGLGLVFERAQASGRIEFFDFNPNPLVRHTFWSIIFGGFLTSLTVYGSNQATIQRYLALASVRQAQFAMYWNLLGTFSILGVCCLSGFVAFAFYHGCDLRHAGLISRYDQILPYFVMDVLGRLPGLPGLFIACVYSAAISTVSSGINSLTAVCLHDFIYPLNAYLKREEISQRASLALSKILTAIFGVMTVAISFSCQYLGATVLQISLSIFGLLGGPLLGVISLGMFFPVANQKGALVGLVASVVINLSLGVGSVFLNPPPTPKPLNRDFCYLNGTNASTTTTTTFASLNATTTVPGLLAPADWYKAPFRLSYYWFSVVGVLVVLVPGLVVSLLTKRSSKQYDPHLVIDVLGFFRTKAGALFHRKEAANPSKSNAYLCVDDNAAGTSNAAEACVEQEDTHF